MTDAEVRAQVDLAVKGSRDGFGRGPPHLPAAASRLGVSEAFLRAYLAGECPASDALRAGAEARKLADDVDRAHGGLGIQEWGPSGAVSGHGYTPLGGRVNGIHWTYAAYVEGARRDLAGIKATKARHEARAAALGAVLARLHPGSRTQCATCRRIQENFPLAECDRCIARPGYEGDEALTNKGAGYG